MRLQSRRSCRSGIECIANSHWESLLHHVLLSFSIANPLPLLTTPCSFFCQLVCEFVHANLWCMWCECIWLIALWVNSAGQLYVWVMPARRNDVCELWPIYLLISTELCQNWVIIFALGHPQHIPISLPLHWHSKWQTTSSAIGGS